MNRTTIRLESGLLRRLKEDAVRHGKTMQECLNEYLRIGMERREREKTRSRDLKLPVYSMGRPFVDLADRHVLHDVLRRT